MLKLIAIQNFNPNSKTIRDKRQHSSIYKVLEPGVVYFFYKGYEVSEDGVAVERSIESKDIELYSVGGLDVDICAIVGKNGSGKSSLIELYLRIMNNFAYVCHRAINEGISYNTQFVDEIYSTVFFYDSIKSESYAIKQFGGTLSFFVGGVEQFSHNYNLPIESSGFKQDIFPVADVAKRCLEALCYTMVINYSAYSYNHEDYLPEWSTVYDNRSDDRREVADRIDERCWIDSLFHKNDGYQLPIVLNPFRDNGMVDYNNERDLTQDRLYHLTLLHSSPITTILNGKVLDRYVFDLDDDLNPKENRSFASYKVMTQLELLGMTQNIDIAVAIDKAEDYGNRIITAWSRCFGLDLVDYLEETKKGEDNLTRNQGVVQALNYVVYKTLKITRVYTAYKRYSDITNDISIIDEYVKDLYNNDRSHITLKIRRCLSYIIFRHYKEGEMLIDKLQRSIERKFNRRQSLMTKARKEHPIENRFNDTLDYEWTEDDFLPAPSFKVNLFLKRNEGRKQTKIALSTMSSGERQFISSISTLAYHVANIESVWKRIQEGSGEIGYRSLCVIFDEMDLYLHPEYQTNMIDLMLQVISEMRLENIRGIQIICSSHSPFILSDIPREHILYLEKGKVYSSQKIRTFAANIGDLLCHSFFLTDGLVGRFARKKVRSLVDWLETRDNDEQGWKKSQNNKNMQSVWTDEKAAEFIRIIDDPFVSLQFREMLKEKQTREAYAQDKN